VFLFTVVVILVVRIEIIKSDPKAQTTTAPPAAPASVTETITEQPLPPTTATEAGSASSSPPSASSQRSPAPLPSQATFIDNSYIDLDTLHPDSTPSTTDEIGFDKGQMVFGQGANLWPQVRVVLVPDSAASRDGCDNSTELINRESLSGGDVPKDHSICVSTSDNRWVVLKSADHTFERGGIANAPSRIFTIHAFDR
jgi:hypothetical protein